ncbi:sugar ABC transporter ATP-binding protein [Skermanella stibiiresistens]|nr:sugar ABC transporter ATP-binding protein [Skermanella stibiiresistens]
MLALAGVSKSFPGVKALDDVRLELRAGEVMALVGENGAGKSTLVKILTGIERPDAGGITIDGSPVSFGSPHDAWLAGITAIHQETVMFDDLTVAENIHMGHHPTLGRGPFRRFVDWRAMKARTRAVLARLEVDIQPDTVLRDLTVARKHIVGIAKALSHDARIVIMDEPTAALSQHEIAELYKIVGQLKAAGKAILFISHKFDEIFAIADRWTVLRDGRFIGAGAIGEVTRDELVTMMVGRRLDQVFPKITVPLGETVLEVNDLSHPTEFDGIGFKLRRGEILGFYGLVGAGRSEAMQALFGITKPSRGRVRIAGRDVVVRNPSDAIRAGIAYVPEDRQVQGAILPMGITENITLPVVDRVNGGPVLRPARERAVARRFGERLAVKATHWDQPVGTLSGGNQQKVLIAKWLATNPAVIILDEPTKGIDVGSKAAVHEFMGELVRSGLAVILVSSELPEIMGMSDTIIVMHEGRIRRRFSRAEATAEAIVTAATGGG